jgi:hypothetical protein
MSMLRPSPREFVPRALYMLALCATASIREVSCVAGALMVGDTRGSLNADATNAIALATAFVVGFTAVAMGVNIVNVAVAGACSVPH